MIEAIRKLAGRLKNSRAGLASLRRLIANPARAPAALHRSSPPSSQVDSQNAELFSTFFAASPLPICICRLADRRITEVNETFLKTIGYRRDEALNHTLLELGFLLEPRSRDRAPQTLFDPVTIRDLEATFCTKQGETRHALLSTERIDLGGERRILIYVSDITEQKRAAEDQARLLEQVRAGRERLHVLSKRLLEVQESERRQIARELHDEVGQALTGLKFVLQIAARSPAENTAAKLDEAQTLVNELIARVRDLSLELRPAMLDDFGLLPALLWYVERFGAQTQIRVDLGHSGMERRLAPEVETAGYRIVQEALTNIARHGSDSEATVRMWIDDNVLHLKVEDWGNGFDVDTALASNRTGGLTGMRERAILLGGQLTIESVPGVGTRVSAELPLSGSHLERRERERNHPSGR